MIWLRMGRSVMVRENGEVSDDLTEDTEVSEDLI
jgi:hypothetical protein